MFIELIKNNGTDYLRLVEGYAFTENGVTKHRRRVVKNIGPLSRYDDGKPEYLARLRRSFADGEPIIEGLAGLAEEGNTQRQITIPFNLDKEKDCFCAPKNCGYLVLDSLYDQLGIYDAVNHHKHRHSIAIDVNGICKLLVFGRVLSPDSKFATFEGKDDYLFPVTRSEKVSEVYTALDCLNAASEAIQKRMNLKIRQAIGRDTEICFYDVTNYYFEIEENDEDVLDGQGRILARGLRKKGVSKENRGEPIVQMGLFMDDQGIPISYQLFPGNNTDQTTLRPALSRTVYNMNFGRVIIVADGGLNNGPNIAHILDAGNGYIVSKSTKKSDKTVKAWMLNESDYRWNDARTFKVKSQVRTRQIKAEDGTVRNITEKLVCYWSKRHYERERRGNEKFIEYLESVVAFPDKLKDKPRKVEKFLRKTEFIPSTGEVVKTATSLSLHMDRIREYLDLMGYYTIMTSEIDKSDEEIISKYHGLSRIEDSFRVTKSDLLARPVFVRTPEHINAHFLTCFIALTMIRLIQRKVLISMGKPTRTTECWESGLSADRIHTALRNWQADPLPGGYYRMTKPSPDLVFIARAFGFDPYLRLPIAPHLHKLKSAIDTILM